jgi:7-cyano-7-deazaguanine reductase
MAQEQRDRVLGRGTSGPITAQRLDVVPWTHEKADAVVEFTTNELTATCPITSQPDFYELKLSYRPKASLIESKALKLYLWSFRDRGIFAEDLAATLLEDLVGACDPLEMTVDLTQQVRGGLKSYLFAWLLCQEADRTVAGPNRCHRRKYGLRQALPDGHNYPFGKHELSWRGREPGDEIRDPGGRERPHG